MAHEVDAKGIVRDQSGAQVGYIKDGVVFRGGDRPMFGDQVGYIRDDVIYRGGGSPMFGDQVGYVKDGVVYRGGKGGSMWGDEVGKASYPNPIENAAARFLLS